MTKLSGYPLYDQRYGEVPTAVQSICTTSTQPQFSSPDIEIGHLKHLLAMKADECFEVQKRASDAACRLGAANRHLDDMFKEAEKYCLERAALRSEITALECERDKLAAECGKLRVERNNSEAKYENLKQQRQGAECGHTRLLKTTTKSMVEEMEADLTRVTEENCKLLEANKIQHQKLEVQGSTIEDFMLTINVLGGDWSKPAAQQGAVNLFGELSEQRREMDRQSARHAEEIMGMKVEVEDSTNQRDIAHEIRAELEEKLKLAKDNLKLATDAVNEKNVRVNELETDLSFNKGLVEQMGEWIDERKALDGGKDLVEEKDQADAKVAATRSALKANGLFYLEAASDLDTANARISELESLLANARSAAADFSNEVTRLTVKGVNVPVVSPEEAANNIVNAAIVVDLAHAADAIKRQIAEFQSQGASFGSDHAKMGRELHSVLKWVEKKKARVFPEHEDTCWCVSYETTQTALNGEESIYQGSYGKGLIQVLKEAHAASSRTDKVDSYDIPF